MSIRNDFFFNLLMKETLMMQVRYGRIKKVCKMEIEDGTLQ